MKKKLIAALTAGAMAAMSLGMGASAEVQDVSLTVWGAEEDQAMLQEMINSFEEQYGEYANFTIQLGVESESTAKDTILTDIQAAADVFAFASDQLPDLVKAGALQSLDELDPAIQNYAGKSLDDIKNANVSGSVEAATYDGTMYAFPMSADNGFFLFYDSSVLSEEDVASWDSLLAAAEAAGKKVGMTLSSGWYNASFFYGAGFTTGLNDDGTTSIDWNGTSADGYTGVQVVQSMLGITGHGSFLSVADGDISNQIASGDLCAAVSGTWDATAAQKAFGDGYAATKLPTFTLNGEQVQQGSVAGFKLIGVNAYSQNAGWAALLAEWLTNEENQAIRFEQREIGPSNIAVSESSEVSENLAIAALAEQSAYGVVQSVGTNYWDPTATFGEMIAQGQLSADDEAGIQEALDTMVAGVTAPVE
ncbi:MAG TPA: extracellular solute-binding protein [Candidatus Limivivens intestinipullorum]|uniref:Extracellular solute-binding protein n=1 Tax=Candidatus Limivivens intestinipullorum TaxID=2840858 RepID=A0A9D1ES94_9FIRM|nr:extracellular solute-binding protein [Candidatus Limivivens intestinipullorum]